MLITPSILTRHLHEAAAEQLAEEYRSLGYEVEAEVSLNGFQADLVARRGNEVIVFEIKTAPLSRGAAERVSHLKDYVAQTLGGAFRLVLVGVPEPVEVEVEAVEQILEEEAGARVYDQLAGTASHFHSLAVEDVEYESVRIDHGQAELRGSASLWLTAQYGSDGDVVRGDGDEIEMWFSLRFHILLDLNGDVPQLAEVRSLEIVQDESVED